MAPNLRKLALTMHVVSSVGWLGAVVAYLALAIVGLTSSDGQRAGAAYLSMEVVGWYVVVPSSLAALLSGLVESLDGRWGLFRHWWISAKVLLTTSATLVLLRHMQAVTGMSGVAAGTTLSTTDFRVLRIQLVFHAVGGLVVLLSATALSIYKPWGLTPYGRRKQIKARTTLPADTPVQSGPGVSPSLEFAATTPRWVYAVGIHAIGLALLFLAIHVTGAFRVH